MGIARNFLNSKAISARYSGAGRALEEAPFHHHLLQQTKTEIVFVLDKSGSMSGSADAVRKCVNDIIRQQQQEESSRDTLVTTVLFSNGTELLHDRIILPYITEMTQREYSPRGGTALLDAMGDTVRYIDCMHRREGSTAGRTVVIILTDGEENASHKYPVLEIRNMIRQHQRDGWEFLFLGADSDARNIAAEYGVLEDHAVNFIKDPRGFELCCRCLSRSISRIRRDEPIGIEWKRELDSDYRLRSK